MHVSLTDHLDQLPDHLTVAVRGAFLLADSRGTPGFDRPAFTDHVLDVADELARTRNEGRGGDPGAWARRAVPFDAVIHALLDLI